MKFILVTSTSVVIRTLKRSWADKQWNAVKTKNFSSLLNGKLLFLLCSVKAPACTKWSHMALALNNKLIASSSFASFVVDWAAKKGAFCRKKARWKIICSSMTDVQSNSASHIHWCQTHHHKKRFITIKSHFRIPRRLHLAELKRNEKKIYLLFGTSTPTIKIVARVINSVRYQRKKHRPQHHG